MDMEEMGIIAVQVEVDLVATEEMVIIVIDIQEVEADMVVTVDQIVVEVEVMVKMQQVDQIPVEGVDIFHAVDQIVVVEVLMDQVETIIAMVYKEVEAVKMADMVEMV